MTQTIKTVVLYLVRILVLWVVDAISLAIDGLAAAGYVDHQQRTARLRH